MSTHTAGSTPVGFTLFSAVAAGGSFVLSTLYGVFALAGLYGAGEEALLFGITFLLAFSVAKSQDLLKRQELYASENSLGTGMKIGTVLVNFVYTNVVVIVAAIIGSGVMFAVSAPYGVVVGVGAVTVYAFWEIETRPRGLPVSVGGLLVLVLALVIMAFAGTQRMASLLREFDLVGGLGERRSDVIRLLGVSEETPVYLTARRFG